MNRKKFNEYTDVFRTLISAYNETDIDFVEEGLEKDIVNVAEKLVSEYRGKSEMPCNCKRDDVVANIADAAKQIKNSDEAAAVIIVKIDDLLAID